MKKFTILLTFLILASFAFAQAVDEGFETWPPPGWTLDPQDGAGSWVQNDGSTRGPGDAYAGDFAAMFNNYDYASGVEGSMTSPQFDISGNISTTLSFYWWNDDGTYNPAYIDIFTSTNGTDFELLETLETYGSGGWLLYETGLESDVVKVKITAISDYGIKNTFIDSFVIAAPPNCLPPSNLSAGEITQTTALLDWDENGEATMWNIEFGEADFTPTEVPTYPGISKPYLVEGLEASTPYDFYVQADCGTKETSPWVGPFTFTTQTVTPAPYFEGFAVTSTPEAWTITGWSIGTARGANGNPGNNIYKNLWSSATTATFTTINIGTIADDMLLTFDYKTSNYSSPYSPPAEGSGDFVVSISTDFGNTYSEIETQVNNAVAGWQAKSYNLAAYVGENIKIKIVGNRFSGDYDLAFDNFKVDFAPDCLPPSDLNVTEVTTSSAILNWTQDGDATLFNIEFGEAGFIPTETPTWAGVTNPYLVEGLDPATAYDFYVQTDCGTNDLSVWVGPYTFLTLCDAVTVPYSENFDGDWAGDPPAPACWTVINANSDSYLWSQSAQYLTPHSGSWVAHGMGNTDDWLISPQIDLSDINANLKWWDVVESSSFVNSYKVLVSTTDINIASFTDELADIDCSNTAWEEHILNLSDYNGQLIYVAFYQYGSGSNFYGFGIDDFSIEELPPPGLLYGVVTDVDTDEPIEGVEVLAMPAGLSSFTNADGEYELELFAGTYDISFIKPEYYEVTVEGLEIASLEVLEQNAALEILPMPNCADVIYPAPDQTFILPNQVTFEWEQGSEVPVDGYRISIYDFFYNQWIVEGFDVGASTTYTLDLEWNRNYGWQVQPYNINGLNDNCPPDFFATSNKGIIEGLVTDSESGLPLGDVMVDVVEVSPNAGASWSIVTAPDGTWALDWQEGLEEGTYDISFAVYGYEDKTINGFNVQPHAPTQMVETLDKVEAFALPFSDDFSSGNFEAQMWDVEPYVENWRVDITLGNPAPAANFYWGPQIEEAYATTLQSYYLDGVNETTIYAQFDMFFDYWNEETVESLSFVVFDGVEWNVIDTWDNTVGENIPWTTFTYDISEFAAGKVFLIGFLAEGEDTYNIDDWYVDNVLVSTSIFELQPNMVADALFAGETAEHTFDVVNNGNVALDWAIDLISVPAWASFDITSGSLDPGMSEMITVTLDANISGAGMFNENVMFEAMSGLLQATLALELQVYEEAGQKIMIPEAGQWGYISSFVNLDSKMSLEDALADIEEELVIMVGETGIYWPGYEINTIGNYNTYEGYKMKMGGTGALAFLGDMVEDQKVTFPAGTHILPILSNSPVDVVDFLEGKPVEFAFGMNGTVYWPEGPVYSLETFLPGYGYLIKITEETTFDFAVELPKGTKPNNPPQFENVTTWNDVYRTGDFHMVGVSQDATLDLEAGDIIGAFNAQGICAGMMNYTGNHQALAVPVFADDYTTEAIDGMAEAELLTFKIFRDGNEVQTNPAYSPEMPNSDGYFASNGLSMITSFKAGATSIGDESTKAINIYPNPSSGLFTIDGIMDTYRMEVANSQGQVITRESINNNYSLDISDQPTGIYYIRLVNQQGVRVIKVIKQ